MTSASLGEYDLTRSTGYFSSISNNSAKNKRCEFVVESKMTRKDQNDQQTTKYTKNIQAICTWFESWQTWQQHILFTGLINRLTKSQLRSVSMAIESVFHRDFAASYKDVYPMKKVWSSQKTPDSFPADAGEETLLSSSDKLEILYHGSTKSSAKNKNSMSASKKFEKNLSPTFVTATSSNSKVHEENDNTLHIVYQDFDQTSVSSRNLSPIVEQDDALSPPIINQHLSTVNAFTAPNVSAILNENKSGINASIGSAHSVAPSLSPIEETSPESTSSPVSGTSPTKITPIPGVKSSNIKQRANPKKIKENQDIIPRPDSKASIWTMGPSDSVQDEKEFDFRSSVTPLSVESADFFAITKKQEKLGKFITSESRAGSAFLKRLDQQRNKVPMPMACQIYKHSKLWSSQQKHVAANTNNLKKEYKKQLSQIWNWADNWEEHVFVRLLLQLLSFSDGSFEKYVADNIKQRQNEDKLAQMTSQLLPDQFWLEVFKCLPLPDLLSAGLVCKHWFYLSKSDALWKTKCEEIGKTYNVPQLVNLVEQTAGPTETLDWKQACIELYQRLNFHAPKIAAVIPRPPSITTTEDSSSTSDDETTNQDKYKAYVSFSKSKNLNLKSSKTVFPQKPMLEKQRKKKELPTNDRESISKRSDRCYEIDLWDELFCEDEMKEMHERGEQFAVDYRLPLQNRDRYWLVNSVILPVQHVQVLEAHRGAVTCIVCNGKRIISGGLDRGVRIWSESGECFAKLDTSHKGSVQGIAIGADDRCRKVYTSSWDTNVCAWDSITGKLLNSLVGHTDSVSAVAVDAKYLVSSSHDGTIRVWDIRTYECIHVIEHHEGAIHCMSYEERLITTGGADKLVLVTDPDTGILIYTFEGHTSAVNAITRQQNLIASGDIGGNVIFWSLSGDQGPMEQVKAHDKQINQIAFHGGRFFTASNDSTVKEWELMTMTCVRVMQGHSDAVTGVQFTNRFLVTCSKDSSIRLWWWGGEDDSAKTE